MKFPLPTSWNRLTARLGCALVLTLAGARLHAAAAGTASIRGSVSNAATAANLENASVRVKGSNQEYLTERDGTFQIVGLAPGTYDLIVNYVGLDAQTRTVSLGAGESARQDFALT